MLELAVLALLSESPMHGYELRKRLSAVLGSFHRFSYGSLYPCLRKMQAEGRVTANDSTAAGRLGGRSKVVYTLTAEGKERLTDLLGEGGPSSWEDEMFGVRFAFFGKTDAAVRLRILEGRRGRLEERREKVRNALTRTRERFDSYTLELQRHGLESVEREVRWLTELIETERAQTPERDSAPARGPTTGGARPMPAPEPAGPPPADTVSTAATAATAADADGATATGPDPGRTALESGYPRPGSPHPPSTSSTARDATAASEDHDGEVRPPQ